MPHRAQATKRVRAKCQSPSPERTVPGGLAMECRPAAYPRSRRLDYPPSGGQLAAGPAGSAGVPPHRAGSGKMASPDLFVNAAKKPESRSAASIAQDHSVPCKARSAIRDRVGGARTFPGGGSRNPAPGACAKEELKDPGWSALRPHECGAGRPARGVEPLCQLSPTLAASNRLRISTSTSRLAALMRLNQPCGRASELNPPEREEVRRRNADAFDYPLSPAKPRRQPHRILLLRAWLRCAWKCPVAGPGHDSAVRQRLTGNRALPWAVQAAAVPAIMKAPGTPACSPGMRPGSQMRKRSFC